MQRQQQDEQYYTSERDHHEEANHFLVENIKKRLPIKNSPCVEVFFLYWFT